MSPNDFLWSGPDKLGWWFWIPLSFIGAYGMFYLYKLAAPETMLGRIIRVFLSLGFLALVFSLFMNGLGPYAFYAITIGTVLLVRQIYGACLAAGKIKPAEGVTVIERMANRVQEQRHHET